MFKVCEKCGVTYDAPPTKAKRFCSKECAGNLPTPVVVQCQQCGINIQTFPALINRKRFCSRKCQGAYRSIHFLKTYTCRLCGTEYHSPPTRERVNKYCSSACSNHARGASGRGKDGRIKKSCEVCGKEFLSYEYRNGKYCSRSCNGKATIDKRVNHNRISSKIEDTIKQWLDGWGVAYKQQHSINHYVVDFFIKDSIVIEVNGCYWHGCSACFPDTTERQRARQIRDKRLAGYCKNRGIPLLVVWEHDIRKGDFSALMPLLR